ncbi:MAG: hypothetical protein EXR78_08570 [Deltaproteobacteria bacterium]|nr:hypothetical protein [Deltaproteobacteria bacterium]
MADQASLRSSEECPAPRRLSRWAPLAVVYACLLLGFWQGNYAAYPFYDLQGSDADPVYAAQTVLLINDGDLDLIIHPGATMEMVFGTAYSMLGLVDRAHAELSHLADARNADASDRILTTAVRSGRVVALVIIMALAFVVYDLLLRLTGSALCAFALTFFVATSPGVFLHAHIIRPESLSLLSLLLAGLLALAGMNRLSETPHHWRAVLLFLGVGLCLGFAVFAKIQVIPYLAIFVVVLGVAALSSDRVLSVSEGTAWRLAACLAFAPLVLMPYWSMRRPDFLTPELVATLSPDFQQAYGVSPSSFAGAAFIGAATWATFQVAITLWRTRSRSPIAARAWNVATLGTLVLLGVVLSLYLVLLPVSRSWGGYVHNTRHLVYSTLTNITTRAFLENRNEALMGHLRKIAVLHAEQSRLLGFNVLWYVAIAALWAVFRLVRKSDARLLRALPLALFTTGLVMDVFSSMRWRNLYAQYAIYSVVPYAIGLGLVLWWEVRSRRLREAMLWAVALTQFILIAGPLALANRASGQSTSSKEIAWSNVRALVPQFGKYLEYAATAKREFSRSAHDAAWPSVLRDFGPPVGAWNMKDAGTRVAESSGSPFAGGLRVEQPMSMRLEPIFAPGPRRLVVESPRWPDGGFADLTFSLWVAILRLPSDGVRGETLLCGEQSLQIALTVINGAGYLPQFFGYYGGGVGGISVPVPAGDPSWHHLVVTKSADLQTLFLDGQAASSRQPVAAHVTLTNPTGCNLLERMQGATFELASFVVWPRALDKAAVARLYALQAGQAPSPRRWLQEHGGTRRYP